MTSDLSLAYLVCRLFFPHDYWENRVAAIVLASLAPWSLVVLSPWEFLFPVILWIWRDCVLWGPSLFCVPSDDSDSLTVTHWDPMLLLFCCCSVPLGFPKAVCYLLAPHSVARSREHIVTLFSVGVPLCQTGQESVLTRVCPLFPPPHWAVVGVGLLRNSE